MKLFKDMSRDDKETILTNVGFTVDLIYGHCDEDYTYDIKPREGEVIFTPRATRLADLILTMAKDMYGAWGEAELLPNTQYTEDELIDEVLNLIDEVHFNCGATIHDVTYNEETECENTWLGFTYTTCTWLKEIIKYGPDFAHPGH